MFGMAQRTREPRLEHEALRRPAVRSVERRELLDGDEAPKVGLPCQVHDPHPTVAELLQQLIAAYRALDLRHEPFTLELSLTHLGRHMQQNFSATRFPEVEPAGTCVSE